MKNSHISHRKNNHEEESSVGKKRVIRSAAFLMKALENPLRCPICNGLMHRNSMSGDHKRRREDGGEDTVQNLQMTHFFCNSIYKEKRVAIVMTPEEERNRLSRRRP
jgi:hypothetical protein